MGHRRYRHHKKNRFRKNNFKPKEKDNLSLNKPPQQSKNYENLTIKKNTLLNFRNKITLRYKILLSLLVFNLIIYLFFEFIFTFLIVIDIIFVILWIWGWANTCPKCKSYWARKLIDRNHFGTHTEFENVTRNISHRDSSGNFLGSSSIRDTKPVTMHTIQNHWNCRYCNYSWSGRIHDVRG